MRLNAVASQNVHLHTWAVGTVTTAEMHCALPLCAHIHKSSASIEEGQWVLAIWNLTAIFTLSCGFMLLRFSVMSPLFVQIVQIPVEHLNSLLPCMPKDLLFSSWRAKHTGLVLVLQSGSSWSLTHLPKIFLRLAFQFQLYKIIMLLWVYCRQQLSITHMFAHSLPCTPQ